MKGPIKILAILLLLCACSCALVAGVVIFIQKTNIIPSGPATVIDNSEFTITIPNNWVDNTQARKSEEPEIQLAYESNDKEGFVKILKLETGETLDPETWTKEKCERLIDTWKDLYDLTKATIKVTQADYVKLDGNPKPYCEGKIDVEFILPNQELRSQNLNKFQYETIKVYIYPTYFLLGSITVSGDGSTNVLNNMKESMFDSFIVRQ